MTLEFAATFAVPNHLADCRQVFEVSRRRNLYFLGLDLTLFGIIVISIFGGKFIRGIN